MLRTTLAVVVAGVLCLGTIGLAATPGRTATALDRVMPELKFTGVALTDAIDFLRDTAGANLHVNWRALQSVGITPDTLINIRLRGVSLRKALTLMLAEAGGGTGVSPITFTLDGGVIEITTREIADRKMYTRVYPVEDLLMEIPNFEGPQMSLQSSGGREGGGGSAGPFGESRSGDDEEGTTKQERADQLVELIRDTIYPDMWREAGGPASIRYFRGNLIVTAPRSVHEAIGG
ncbi:MAG: hypothetical protein ACREIT_02110 [Tepidisphaeraceae bacterium]